MYTITGLCGHYPSSSSVLKTTFRRLDSASVLRQKRLLSLDQSIELDPTSVPKNQHKAGIKENLVSPKHSNTPCFPFAVIFESSDPRKLLHLQITAIFITPRWNVDGLNASCLGGSFASRPPVRLLIFRQLFSWIFRSSGIWRRVVS
jgi:hypothetical protein